MVDGLEVDLRDGHVKYSMTINVADISENCIMGLDYLVVIDVVIDLSQAVVNGTIVKRNYKYAVKILERLLSSTFTSGMYRCAGWCH